MALNEELDMVSHLIDFVVHYKWAYHFKWTEFLIKKPWEKMPSEWCQFFQKINFETLKDVCLFSEDNYKNDERFDQWPKSLFDFVLTSNKIAFLIKDSLLPDSQTASSLSYKESQYLNPKKHHEIISLINFLLGRPLNNQSVSHIVDLGSGLAHMPRVLESKTENLSILCVEGDFSLHNRAPQEKHSNRIRNIHFHLNKHNLDEFARELDNHVGPESSVCLTGLHCCGDLTSLGILHFVSSPRVKQSVLVGCCYHKIQRDNQLLPLSTYFKTKEFDLPVPGLRLACQESIQKWKHWTEQDFLHHQVTVLTRCILEQYLQQNSLPKLPRAASRRKVPKSFDELRDYFHCLVCDHGDILGPDILHYLESDSVELGRSMIEPVLMLQMVLQPVLEVLILFDRVLYIREQGYCCDLVRLFDPRISPRCLAIYASKSEV